MRVALDSLGTDHAPTSEIEGALRAVQDHEGTLSVVLVGDADAIRRELAGTDPRLRSRVEIVHAPERILPAEPPAQAVRRKKDSSIVQAVRLQREGVVDAFVSGGSTGAIMAASLIHLRPLPGVDRPAICTLLPTSKRPILLLDAGANVDCKPHHLLQFARLGAIYARDLMEVPEARIGLLNIGEEPEKGDELAIEAHRLLRESGLNFVGNVEGRDIIRGVCDVLICDGFVGNVLLKFYESVAEFTIGLLTSEMARVGSAMDLEEVFRVLDYAEYGGAPLLGVNGVSIVCHGRSTSKAIRNAIGLAAQAVRSGVVSHIQSELAVSADDPSSEQEGP